MSIWKKKVLIFSILVVLGGVMSVFIFKNFQERLETTELTESKILKNISLPEIKEEINDNDNSVKELKQKIEELIEKAENTTSATSTLFQNSETNQSRN